MSQVQVRADHENGQPLGRIVIRISNGTQSSDEAIFDYETDLAGNKGWPIPHWPQADYTLHVNPYTFHGSPIGEANKSFGEVSKFVPASEFHNNQLIILPRVIPAPVPADLLRRPRMGMSIAGLVVNSASNIEETVKRYVDAGVKDTRINLLSALWPGVDCLPYLREPDGRWNLYNWNQRFFDRVIETRERMNGAGITVSWTNYNLYDWSRRKPGPQQINTPYRHNVNGVFWSDEDVTFGILPDEWSKAWFQKVCPLLDLHLNPFEIGNEFPEKGVHERTKNFVRSFIPNALLQVNRNDDTPGQYANMKIGRDYDFISFHTNRIKKYDEYLSFLSEEFEREPDYQTFNDFFDNCPHDRSRVMWSSDGARTSDDPTHTYNYHQLGIFLKDMKRRGYGVEHQSRAKMTPAPNHDMIEVDWFRANFAD